MFFLFWFLLLKCFVVFKETILDNALRTISYIADIGNIVVLMARRRLPHCDSQENVEVSDPSQDSKHQHKMICHVFESEDVSSVNYHGILAPFVIPYSGMIYF